MKIYIGVNHTQFNGTVKDLHAKMESERGDDHCLTMYTLTDKAKGDGSYQFRAWKGPFANFTSDHVDTGRDEDRLFTIEHTSKEELVVAVWPFIEGKARWRPETRLDVTLWLAWRK